MNKMYYINSCSFSVFCPIVHNSCATLQFMYIIHDETIMTVPQINTIPLPSTLNREIKKTLVKLIFSQSQ